MNDSIIRSVNQIIINLPKDVIISETVEIDDYISGCYRDNITCDITCDITNKIAYELIEIRGLTEDDREFKASVDFDGRHNILNIIIPKITWIPTEDGLFKCPKCNGINYKETKFCPHCGINFD